MKINLQILFVTLISVMFSQAQEVTVDISMGAGYSNEVYYKLSTQTETIFPVSQWDIAFLRTSNFDLGVRVNDGVGIQVFEAANTPAGYDTVDVTNESTWTQLYNSDTNWNNGAFMNTSLTGGLAFGFGNYNPSSNAVEGQIVFVLKYQDGSYKKFFIEDYLGAYTFKYSSWTGSAWTADITETVSNSSNPNNRFNYYSLQTESEVIAEPAAADWDFVFRKYNTFLNPPGQYYNVTGVLHNPNVEIAKNDEPGGMPMNPDLTFSDDINSIGYDWKSFSGSGFVVDTDKAFYIKYADDTVYRLTFTAFSGTSSGDLTFVINNVTDALSIADVSQNVSFGIYPNPSTDKQINLVYDINTLIGNNNNVAIYSSTGQKIYETQLKSESGFYNKTLNLSSLASGIYVLQFTSGAYSSIKKIILN
jgi:hypothetical protein